MYKWLLFIIFTLLLLACRRPQANQISIAKLVDNSGKGYYHLSSNGTYYSFINTKHSYEALYVCATKALVRNNILINDTTTERSINNVVWLNDNTLVYSFKDSKDVYHFKIKNMISRRCKRISSGLKDKFKLISVSNDAKHLYLAINKIDSMYSDVYDLNISSGILKLKIKNFGNVTSWYTDQYGEIRAARVTKDNYKEFWFRANALDTFRKIIQYPVEAYFTPYFDAKNPNLAVVQQNIWTDKASVITYDFAQKKILNIIFSHPKYDVSQFYFSKRRNRVEALFYNGFFQNYHYFGAKYVKINAQFKRVFKGPYRFYLLDISKNERFMVFGVDKDDYFGGYFLYDAFKNKLSHLADYNSKLPINSKEKLHKRDTISFVNSNGFEVQGYVTPTYQPTKAPLLVLIHQNITQRDVWRFSVEAQFFADRGYNVYQLNYSGSTGYGRKFRDLGNKQINGNIQRDILQGIETVIKRYRLKDQKVVLYGKGMAGCIALQTAAEHPSIVKAVITNTAYLNLFSYVRGIATMNKSELPITYKRIGDPITDTEYFKSVSPIFNVQKINVPVMVAHNLSDPSSSANEYFNYVKLMQNANKDIYYFSILNNKHIYYFDTYDLSFFEHVNEFLKKIK